MCTAEKGEGGLVQQQRHLLTLIFPDRPRGATRGCVSLSHRRKRAASPVPAADILPGSYTYTCIGPCI